MDLDLTGSPLKDDCHIDFKEYTSLGDAFKVLKAWSDEEETHTPIDMDLARQILMDLHQEPFHDAKGSVFILCHENSDKSFLKEAVFDDGCFKEGCVRYNVRFSNKISVITQTYNKSS